MNDPMVRDSASGLEIGLRGQISFSQVNQGFYLARVQMRAETQRFSHPPLPPFHSCAR